MEPKKRKIEVTWVAPSAGHRCPYTMAEFEERVDEICGCAGRFDCRCVSVFNRASGELWGEHNDRQHRSA